MIRSNSSIEAGAFVFPDLTALLDVIFILLVFLLLTSQIAPQALKVELPEAEAVENLVIEDDITITLYAEKEHWALNGREYRHWLNFSAALSQMVNEKPKASIIVAGDKQVSLQQLLQVFDWLKQNNLSAAEVLVD